MNAGSRRNFRFAFSILLAFAAFRGMVLLSSLLEQNFSLSADLSATQRYSIGSETKTLLRGLDKNVLIYVLNSPGNTAPGLRSLLSRYEETSSRIDVIELDPIENASFLARFDSLNTGLEAGSVIVSNSDYSCYRQIRSVSRVEEGSDSSVPRDHTEADLTSAIDYVSSGIQLRARILSGHRETDLSSLTKFSSLLDNLGYSISTYDPLRTGSQLDVSTDLLLVISPKTDLTEYEYNGIVNFLSAGGNALFAMDNALYDSLSANLQILGTRLPYFDMLLARYGLSLNQDLILCTDTNSTNLRATSLILSPSKHAITSPIGGHPIVFGELSSINLRPNSKNVLALLSTSETCYSKQLSAGTLLLSKMQGDPSGSFIAGALSTDNNSTIALFSSSSFLTNDGLQISGNEQLLSLTATYLLNPRISIDAKPVGLYSNPLSTLSIRHLIVAASATVILPSVVMLFGLAIFLRRRRK